MSLFIGNEKDEPCNSKYRTGKWHQQLFFEEQRYIHMNQLCVIKFCHMMENRKSFGYLPDKVWQEYYKSQTYTCPKCFFFRTSRYSVKRIISRNPTKSITTRYLLSKANPAVTPRNIRNLSFGVYIFNNQKYT